MLSATLYSRLSSSSEKAIAGFLTLTSVSRAFVQGGSPAIPNWQPLHSSNLSCLLTASEGTADKQPAQPRNSSPYDKSSPLPSAFSTPRKAFIIIMQRKSVLVALCNTLANQQDLATREEILFSFQPWPQKSALSLSHRALVAVPPAQSCTKK